MPEIGGLELVIVAVMALLLFGPGKAGDLGSALGRGIREFRKASRDDVGGEPAPPARAKEHAEAPRSCSECGAALAMAQRFCSNCGTPVAVAS